MPFDRTTDLTAQPTTTAWTLADGARLHLPTGHDAQRGGAATSPTCRYLVEIAGRPRALDLGELIAERRGAAAELRDAAVDAALRGVVQRVRAWLQALRQASPRAR